MATVSPNRTFTQSDYQSIETALRDTERGRWFLEQHAMRNRRADPHAVMDAPTRETGITGIQASGRHEVERRALAGLRGALAGAAAAEDAGGGRGLAAAADALEELGEATAGATREIRIAAERILELAWTMREQGAEAVLCDRLDGFASRIVDSCAFQDRTGRRADPIVRTLRAVAPPLEALTEAADSSRAEDFDREAEPEIRKDDAVLPAVAGPADPATVNDPRGSVAGATDGAADPRSPHDEPAQAASAAAEWIPIEPAGTETARVADVFDAPEADAAAAIETVDLDQFDEDSEARAPADDEVPADAEPRFGGPAPSDHAEAGEPEDAVAPAGPAAGSPTATDCRDADDMSPEDDVVGRPPGGPAVAQPDIAADIRAEALQGPICPCVETVEGGIDTEAGELVPEHHLAGLSASIEAEFDRAERETAPVAGGTLATLPSDSDRAGRDDIRPPSPFLAEEDELDEQFMAVEAEKTPPPQQPQPVVVAADFGRSEPLPEADALAPAAPARPETAVKISLAAVDRWSNGRKIAFFS